MDKKHFRTACIAAWTAGWMFTIGFALALYHEQEASATWCIAAIIAYPVWPVILGNILGGLVTG